MQDPAPAAAYRPVWQSVQIAEPAEVYLPPGQLEQVACPPAETCPAWQRLLIVQASVWLPLAHSAYPYPGEQLVVHARQLLLPIALEYRPVSHWVAQPKGRSARRVRSRAPSP